MVVGVSACLSAFSEARADYSIDAPTLTTIEKTSLRRLVDAVVRTRGLAAPASLCMRTASRNEIGEKLALGAIARHEGDSRTATRQAAIARNAAAKVLALYAPDEKCILLTAETRRGLLAIGARSARLEQAVLHELTHALQDRAFDLMSFLHEPGLSADALEARMMLIEGDADLTSSLAASTLQIRSGASLNQAMMLSADDSADGESAGDDDAVLMNRVLQSRNRQVAAQQEGATGTVMDVYAASLLTTRYQVGRRYVEQAWRRGGFAAVNALYRAPLSAAAMERGR